MKRTIAVSFIALAMLLLLTSSALAVGITEPGDINSGYLDPSLIQPSGQGPHGGYTDASYKCKVCHAVHGASSSGEALLGATKANACVYCHITGGISSLVVYEGDAANYTNEYENNHTDSHGSYNGCVSCHSVHGAGTVAWSTKILKSSPAPRGAGSIAAGVANMNEFCADCHDNRQTTAAANRCSTICHDTDANTQNHVYINAAVNGTSHVMKAADNTHAWVASTNCTSCHKGGAATSKFPHFTSGAFFLADTHTTTTPLDRICLDCHLDTGDPATAAAGVGESF